MRRFGIAISVSSLALAVTLAQPAHAVNVVFGTSWDGASNSLQNILNARYGVNNVHVQTSPDYIGAGVGDPDPFIWTGLEFRSFLIREVAGHANTNILGWYIENGSVPVINGVDDGVVFNGPQGPNTVTMITLGPSGRPFGFYMNPNGTGNATNAPEPELFFTNRFFNDRGPNGTAVHEPFDGDVQALIFDVSSYTQPNTWVVCFEDLDSGPNPTPCCSQTDNDFNDMVFEVTVAHAVSVEQVAFSAFKSMYR